VYGSSNGFQLFCLERREAPYNLFDATLQLLICQRHFDIKIANVYLIKADPKTPDNWIVPLPQTHELVPDVMATISTVKGLLETKYYPSFPSNYCSSCTAKQCHKAFEL
jgi:hypothetical protein